MNTSVHNERVPHEAKTSCRSHGIITHIQRFSLHDGPGIRTTVFFQGCNMKCAWCHNPETISRQPILQYNVRSCINCLKCIPICSNNAHRNENDRHLFDRNKCVNCGACAEICFAHALEMSGQSMSVESVMSEILQDIDYYRNSKGGVTLSGGEVTLQAEFAHSLLENCKSQGIHTAIESNLLVSWEKITSVLEFTDLLMFDIKHINSNQHQKWTGARNETILENARKVVKLGIPLIVRTPIIPGVNDDVESIAEISQFVSQLPNLLYYELLPYNPLAESKYDRLEREYPMHGTHCLTMEKMAELRRVAAASSIIVK